MTKKPTKKRGTRGPGRLSAEQAAELPSRLLDAALSLFTEHGYAQTTMEQIARKAGASTKTIYSRYSNKDEILQAVVRRSVDAIRRPAAETISAHAHDIEPQAFLSGLGRQIVTTISGEGAGLNRILFSEGPRFPEIPALYRAVIAGGRAIIRTGLEQWHKDGLLPLLGDPEQSAALCLSMMTDQARIRSAIGEPLTSAEITAHVNFAVDLFLRACGYKPNDKFSLS